MRVVLLFVVQNQFFITLSKSSQVSNEISEALYQRIVKAHRFVLRLNRQHGSIAVEDQNIVCSYISARPRIMSYMFVACKPYQHKNCLKIN